MHWGGELRRDLARRPTRRELATTAVLLAGAVFETTVNLIGNAIVLLLQHPDQLAMLRDNPERWPRPVEEVLRFDSPVQMTSRTAGCDLELAGQRWRTCTATDTSPRASPPRASENRVLADPKCIGEQNDPRKDPGVVRQTLDHDEVSLLIGATPAVLYGLVTDITRTAEFSPNVARAQWIGGATGSKGSGSGFGDSLVLFAAPAADADGAYYLAGTL
jgi:hypothetical protein